MYFLLYAIVENHMKASSMLSYAAVSPFEAFELLA